MNLRHLKKESSKKQVLSEQPNPVNVMSPGLTRPFSALAVDTEHENKRVKKSANASSYASISKSLNIDSELKRQFDQLGEKVKNFIILNYQQYLEQGYENYHFLLNRFSTDNFIQLAKVSINSNGEAVIPIELRTAIGNPFLNCPAELIHQVEKSLPIALLRAAKSDGSSIPADVGAMQLDGSRLFAKIKTDEQSGLPVKNEQGELVFQFYTVPVKKLMFSTNNQQLPKPVMAEEGCWNFILLADLTSQQDGLPCLEFVVRKGQKGGHKLIAPLRRQVALVAGEIYFDADGQLKLICPRSQYFHAELDKHYARFTALQNDHPVLHALCAKFLGTEPSQFNKGQEALLKAFFTYPVKSDFCDEAMCVLPAGVNYHYEGDEVDFAKRLEITGMGKFMPEDARKKAEALLNAQAPATRSLLATMFANTTSIDNVTTVKSASELAPIARKVSPKA